MRMLRRATMLLFVKIVLSAGLAACAASPPPVSSAPNTPPQLQRMVARSTGDWPSPRAFATEVERVGGVPVRDVALVAPRLYAFTLVCTHATACREATQSLAAARTLLTELQADGRRNLAPSPAAPLSQ